jgi:hypothetical protein
MSWLNVQLDVAHIYPTELLVFHAKLYRGSLAVLSQEQTVCRFEALDCSAKG